MTTDFGIYRSANVLIEHPGKDALIEAAIRADAFLDKSEVVDYLTWKRIIVAVEEILREERRPGEGCNSDHAYRQASVSALHLHADVNASRLDGPLC